MFAAVSTEDLEATGAIVDILQRWSVISLEGIVKHTEFTRIT